ncbi:hypothetical protein SESBI_35643 [Sesbania bispinosa]|nr:hypothetical protein SESBI_35643 [Sesbania bispinosa]
MICARNMATECLRGFLWHNLDHDFEGGLQLLEKDNDLVSMCTIGRRCDGKIHLYFDHHVNQPPIIVMPVNEEPMDQPKLCKHVVEVLRLLYETGNVVNENDPKYEEGMGDHHDLRCKGVIGNGKDVNVEELRDNVIELDNK